MIDLPLDQVRTLPIAVDADSLATWFLPAPAAVAEAVARAAATALRPPSP